MDIIEPSDIGPDKRFKTRTAALAGMQVGDIRYFRAETDVERASVRGSAYNYGRPRGWKFVAQRMENSVVAIKRMADRYQYPRRRHGRKETHEQAAL